MDDKGVPGSKLNPLRPTWNGYFADPMVLRAATGYYAYGTDGPEGKARADSHREFSVLHSHDLIAWEYLGGVLDIPAGREGLAYWAPEVVESGGIYFLYYSCGGPEGEGHQIRVALADQPGGPFISKDAPLMPDELFTIDAHPFQDPLDGNWYLFFAKLQSTSLPGT